MDSYLLIMVASAIVAVLCLIRLARRKPAEQPEQPAAKADWKEVLPDQGGWSEQDIDDFTEYFGEFGDF
jgi:hypothetical protein